MGKHKLSKAALRQGVALFGCKFLGYRDCDNLASMDGARSQNVIDEVCTEYSGRKANGWKAPTVELLITATGLQVTEKTSGQVYLDLPMSEIKYSSPEIRTPNPKNKSYILIGVNSFGAIPKPRCYVLKCKNQAVQVHDRLMVEMNKNFEAAIGIGAPVTSTPFQRPPPPPRQASGPTAEELAAEEERQLRIAIMESKEEADLQKAIQASLHDSTVGGGDFGGDFDITSPQFLPGFADDGPAAGGGSTRVAFQNPPPLDFSDDESNPEQPEVFDPFAPVVSNEPTPAQAPAVSQQQPPPPQPTAQPQPPQQPPAPQTGGDDDDDDDFNPRALGGLASTADGGDDDFNPRGESDPAPTQTGPSIDAFIDALWAKVTTTDTVSSAAAVKLMRASGLDTQELATIWGHADSQKKGFLNKAQFGIAMKMISQRQAGQQISFTTAANVTELPKLGDYTADLVISQPAATSSGEKNDIYDFYWTRAIAPGADSIGPEAVGFFRSSGLSDTALGVVWGLSDTKEPKGKLSKEEFFVALQLIAQCQAGEDPSTDKLSKKYDGPKLEGHTEAAKNSTSGSSVTASTATKTPLVTLADTVAVKLKPSGEQTFSGAELRNVLTLSDLPNPVLAQAWGLADSSKSGKLNLQQLVVLLGLLAQAQNKQPLNVGAIDQNTPPTLRGISESSTAPASAAANPLDTLGRLILQKAKLKESDPIPGATLRPLLQLSDLPNDKLAAIWGLADSKKAGKLDFSQLLVLLGLLSQAQQGQPLSATSAKNASPPKLRGLN